MMAENDVLLYMDSADIFRDKIHQVLKLVEHKDVVLFSPNHTNRAYIKKAVINTIMGGDEAIRDKDQLESNFILLRNNAMVRGFVDQWLKYCEDPMLLTDIKSPDEYPDFKDHRHDQAILTALYYKYNLSLAYDFSLKAKTQAIFLSRRKNHCSLTELTFNKEPASDKVSQAKSKIVDKLVGCQVKRESWW